jgi:hypothetical protein
LFYSSLIAHTEVLEEIEKLVEKNLIQSIQITEKNCIVTVFDPDTKHIILTWGVEIRNRYIKLVDLEKNSPMFKLYHGENVNLQWDDDEVHVVYRVRRNFPKVTTLLTQQGHVIQLIENFTYF